MDKLLTLPVEPVEHDTCPKCGALNGAFERLGGGICNACLSKRVKRAARRKPKRRG